MNTQLFEPMTVLLIITFVVSVRLFLFRLGESRTNKIHPQKMATPEGVAAVMSERAMAASNCFKNMLEMPVVFYVVCLMITLSNQVDAVFLGMAWLFVAFRAVQATIHCTYNGVLHRFISFVLGALICWAMLFRFVLTVL